MRAGAGRVDSRVRASQSHCADTHRSSISQQTPQVMAHKLLPIRNRPISRADSFDRWGETSPRGGIANYSLEPDFAPQQLSRPLSSHEYNDIPIHRAPSTTSLLSAISRRGGLSTTSPQSKISGHEATQNKGDPDCMHGRGGPVSPARAAAKFLPEATPHQRLSSRMTPLVRHSH